MMQTEDCWQTDPCVEGWEYRDVGTTTREWRPAGTRHDFRVQLPSSTVPLDRPVIVDRPDGTIEYSLHWVE